LGNEHCYLSATFDVLLGNLYLFLADIDYHLCYWINNANSMVILNFFFTSVQTILIEYE